MTARRVEVDFSGLDHPLVHVASAPALSELKGPDYKVLGRVEVVGLTNRNAAILRSIFVKASTSLPEPRFDLP